MNGSMVSREQLNQLDAALKARIDRWEHSGLAGAISVMAAVERMREHFDFERIDELPASRFAEALKYLREEFGRR
jgi:DNA repair protein RadC